MHEFQWPSLSRGHKSWTETGLPEFARLRCGWYVCNDYWRQTLWSWVFLHRRWLTDSWNSKNNASQNACSDGKACWFGAYRINSDSHLQRVDDKIATLLLWTSAMIWIYIRYVLVGLRWTLRYQLDQWHTNSPTLKKNQHLSSSYWQGVCCDCMDEPKCL